MHNSASLLFFYPFSGTVLSQAFFQMRLSRVNSVTVSRNSANGDNFIQTNSTDITLTKTPISRAYLNVCSDHLKALCWEVDISTWIIIQCRFKISRQNAQNLKLNMRFFQIWLVWDKKWCWQKCIEFHWNFYGGIYFQSFTLKTIMVQFNKV